MVSLVSMKVYIIAPEQTCISLWAVWEESYGITPQKAPVRINDKQFTPKQYVSALPSISHLP